MHNRALLSAAALATVGLLLAGCSPSERPAAAPSSSQSSSATTSPTASETPLTFDNAVIRAKEAGADMPMTAIFGTLSNPSDHDVTVTGFTSSLGDARYEIHRTENGVMSPVDGGLVIPAGGFVELAPGGFHLMILDFPSAIAAGESVDLTLTTDAGDVEVPGVEVRSMIPGHESYGEDGGMVGHAEHMDHSSHSGQ